MKNYSLFFIGFLLIYSVAFAQNTSCNVKDGLAISGYDVIAYFDGKAKKGKIENAFTYKEANYYFVNTKNLEKFKLNPEAFLPQYGGWCAYAMGTKGEKVDMNPKVFEIRNGKLYLFYNAFFNNTYKKWLSEDTQAIQKAADAKWEKLK